MDLTTLIAETVATHQQWEATWGPFEPHPALSIESKRLREAWRDYTERLTGNYPFFHPRYAGQMLKPPHPAAVAGYVAAMLVNPNNHALDGGPPTGQMEKEVVRDLAAMVHFPDNTLGHLTSGGTIANLEALWIARSLHPDRAIGYSASAHYTHSRMSEVLGIRHEALPVDAEGRLRLDTLEDALRRGRLGTVVVTAGTTGLGTVDPIEEALALCRHYGCRVHVDAAYGGFYALLAWGEPSASLLAEETRQQLRAIAECDSVAIDPHKHGLQPYGCGCILFRDPGVGCFYQHDSPYTYFTSDDLHLGEISLECSRAGAAAGALWFTLRALPLEAEDGLGPILAAGLRAARAWHRHLDASDVLQPFVAPELDIITFLPRTEPFTASRVDRASQDLFKRAMNDPDDPIFLSVYRVDTPVLQTLAPRLIADQPHTRILRSVLMKPTHEHYIDHLHTRVEALCP